MSSIFYRELTILRIETSPASLELRTRRATADIQSQANAKAAKETTQLHSARFIRLESKYRYRITTPPQSRPFCAYSSSLCLYQSPSTFEKCGPVTASNVASKIPLMADRFKRQTKSAAQECGPSIRLISPLDHPCDPFESLRLFQGSLAAETLTATGF
jgi:hypothetical protein